MPTPALPHDELFDDSASLAAGRGSKLLEHYRLNVLPAVPGRDVLTDALAACADILSLVMRHHCQEIEDGVRNPIPGLSDNLAAIGRRVESLDDALADAAVADAERRQEGD